MTRFRNCSPAAENNKSAILTELRPRLTGSLKVLEVGSGSGQHAVHFAGELPMVTWQPAEVPGVLPALRDNLRDAALGNVLEPLALDVADERWPATAVDVVFTANTLHIVSWPLVQAFMRGAGQVLNATGRLILYGPFRYDGAFTTPSNARFDEWLRARDPASGIRDFEALAALARGQGLVLEEDLAMPANNRLLFWRRGEGGAQALLPSNSSA